MENEKKATVGDIVEKIVNDKKFAPDNPDIVKTFINSYIDNMISYFGLHDNKTMIIYISGPVSKVPEHKQRFEDMENDVYKYMSKSCKCHVINPSRIIDNLVENIGSVLTYTDIMFICYSLLSISKVIVYDNRDDKYLDSIGTFSELSFALGRGNIEIMKYSEILASIEAMDTIISIAPTERCNIILEKRKEENSNEPEDK